MEKGAVVPDSMVTESSVTENKEVFPAERHGRRWAPRWDGRQSSSRRCRTDRGGPGYSLPADRHRDCPEVRCQNQRAVLIAEDLRNEADWDRELASRAELNRRCERRGGEGALAPGVEVLIDMPVTVTVPDAVKVAVTCELAPSAVSGASTAPPVSGGASGSEGNELPVVVTDIYTPVVRKGHVKLVELPTLASHSSGRCRPPVPPHMRRDWLRCQIRWARCPTRRRFQPSCHRGHDRGTGPEVHAGHITYPVESDLPTAVTARW